MCNWSVTAKRYGSPHGLSLVWQVDKKAFGGTYCLCLRVTRVRRGQWRELEMNQGN